MSRNVTLIIDKTDVWSSPLTGVNLKSVRVMRYAVEKITADDRRLKESSGVMIANADICGNRWIIPSPEPCLDLVRRALEGIPIRHR
jgi:hypothetical protein